MNALPDDSAYMKIVSSLTHPCDRLDKISKELRKIAQNLEAGKESDPKKIKKLAGSLDYWSSKLHNAGLFLLFNPVKTMKALCEVQKALYPPKEEPPPKPMSPEGKLLLGKYGKAVECLMGIVEKVKTGELSPEDFDSFIERAKELAA